MKKLKVVFKEKQLAELVLWNCAEKLEDYDYKIETDGYMSKTKYKFTFKKKQSPRKPEEKKQ